MPSLGVLEAGVGVTKQAKLKHSSGRPTACNKIKKRRVTETDRLEAIASINRLRAARANKDPG